MSAAAEQEQEEIFESDLVERGGALIQAPTKGQIDPRAWHYFYSAGERELKPRAADTGHARIRPGRLVPLKPFQKMSPNDTMDSLIDRDAPQQIKIWVTPFDAADALMSRFQHRGGRILFPLTGMEGARGFERAVRLFSIVHPAIVCPRDSKNFQRLAAGKLTTCVQCRLDDLRDDNQGFNRSLDRIEKAKLSEAEDIRYGMLNEDEERFISEVEACTIIHGLVLSANEELAIHMQETLLQSQADVEAGKTGPGKKHYDKRDDWYFPNLHLVPERLQALENSKAQGESMVRAVSELIKSDRSGGSQTDVATLIAEMETRHKKDLVELEKRLTKPGKTKAAPAVVAET